MDKIVMIHYDNITSVPMAMCVLCLSVPSPLTTFEKLKDFLWNLSTSCYCYWRIPHGCIFSIINMVAVQNSGMVSNN